jgi:hypothetical protein
MIEKLSAHEMKELILSDNKRVRDQFVRWFEPGIENFAILMTNAFHLLQTIEERVPHEMRSAWTYQFLYIAFNNLFTAFQLLTSGLQVPAGNLMRQYGESLAMALLFSHREINAYERFAQNPSHFPAKTAVDLVNNNRNRQLLGIHQEGWKSFREITKFYNDFSHPSQISIASTHMFENGGRQLGAEVDSEKFDYYEREVSLGISAAMRLIDAIHICDRHLNESAL